MSYGFKRGKYHMESAFVTLVTFKITAPSGIMEAYRMAAQCPSTYTWYLYRICAGEDMDGGSNALEIESKFRELCVCVRVRVGVRVGGVGGNSTTNGKLCA